jgi:phenylalanyl-tRNA synthetase beta chain
MRLIPPDVLMICDPEKPLAFAGVIGGKNSAVSDETSDVLIEAV